MKIILPFSKDKNFPITQRFGEKFLYHGKICNHEGVDWAMPKNTQLIAPFTGTVLETKPDQIDGYGKATYILADDREFGKIQCLIAHQTTINVKRGIKVRIGDNIGLSGNSGFWRGLNGYHLHFGIMQNGRYTDPLAFYKKIETQSANLFNQNEADIKDWLGSYTVQPGDTLWGISIKYYGRGGFYNEIYLVNQDILKNPHTINPGQILRIPALKNKGI